MGLYKTHVIHWKLEVGDHVAWIRNPFFEYTLDPILKVIAVNDNDTVDLEIVESSNGDIVGNQYTDQPLYGFRKAKLTPINDDFTYNKFV